MKKKSFIILFFSISVVLAVFASNRMSVNEIISENVEALSSGDDFDNIMVTIKQKANLYSTPMSHNNNYWGYSAKNDGDMWNGVPKCVGDEKWCHHNVGECWDTTQIPLSLYLYLIYINYMM